jgi:2-oxo-hept-3-ene-1,7-dioate hydratase
MIEDGASRSIESFTLPRAEIELAFVLGKSLRGPGVGLMDVLRATEYIVPAIELLDTRMKSPKTITDTIADNAGAGYLIIGGRAMSPNDFDMRWVPGLIYRNSEIEETGVSAGVLGHPAMGIAWLANRMAQYETTLEAGNIFLSGSFTRPVLGRKGDTLRADFGPMGSVSIHFK